MTIKVALSGQPFAAPCVVLSGADETTATIRGQGRGGRNVEFVPAVAVTLDDLAGVTASMAPRRSPVPCSPPTRSPAPGRQRRPRFFQAFGDSVVTGLTLINVNDFRAIVIDASTIGNPK